MARLVAGKATLELLGTQGDDTERGRKFVRDAERQGAHGGGFVGAQQPLVTLAP